MTPLPLPPLSCLEALPLGLHKIIGSFVDGMDVNNLSLGSRWCLKTFVEEGVSTTTIYDLDERETPGIRGAHYLTAYLRRRRRLKELCVSLREDCRVAGRLALAFVAGSCRHLETLHWDVDRRQHGDSYLSRRDERVAESQNFGFSSITYSENHDDGVGYRRLATFGEFDDEGFEG